LQTGLSEGGQAGVLLAVGSKSFTVEWEKKGAHAAGLKKSEQWMKNNGPSFTNKSKSANGLARPTPTTKNEPTRQP